MKKYFPALRDYALIILSSLIQAASLRLFFIPANLASGGVSGIAQLINYRTDLPIGLMTLIGNIPLFILGWRFLGGFKFMVRTIVAIVAYSFFTDILMKIPFFAYYADILTNDLQGDIFLNALYGAIVSGIGYGMVYRARGTSGGSDILARILNNWRGISMTQSYLMVDALVILSAGFVFGWKEALYALIALYVSGLVADAVLEGGGTARAAMIVTSKPEEIVQRIMNEMVRGVTWLEGRGAYSGASRPVLYCVVSRAEVATLKALVHESDPNAFLSIGVVHEALGEGFKTLKGR